MVMPWERGLGLGLGPILLARPSPFMKTERVADAWSSSQPSLLVSSTASTVGGGGADGADGGGGGEMTQCGQKLFHRGQEFVLRIARRTTAGGAAMCVMARTVTISTTSQRGVSEVD